MTIARRLGRAHVEVQNAEPMDENEDDEKSARRASGARLFGFLKGRMKIIGDIEQPADVAWEAMGSEPLDDVTSDRGKARS